MPATRALAPADDAKPQGVAVEPQALLGISHDDRRVIDAEEHAVARPLPAGVAFAGRELHDFEGVAVRIREGERADAAGARIQLRLQRRHRRGLLDVMPVEPEICLVHIVDGNRDVLKRVVGAACIGGHRVPVPAQILDELDSLGAEAHRDHTNPGSAHAEQRIDFGP